jgi:hypothetical protein
MQGKTYVRMEAFIVLIKVLCVRTQLLTSSYLTDDLHSGNDALISVFSLDLLYLFVLLTVPVIRVRELPRDQVAVSIISIHRSTPILPTVMDNADNVDNAVLIKSIQDVTVIVDFAEKHNSVDSMPRDHDLKASIS